MKAIRIHEFGGAYTLRGEEMSEPALGDDELLVRVKAAGVNPVDTRFAPGNSRASFRRFRRSSVATSAALSPM